MPPNETALRTSAVTTSGTLNANPGFLHPLKEVEAMTMLKVIEVLAQSDKSWEDAAQNAVDVAAKTVKDIKSIYIQDHEAVVKNGKITQYRINAKITFVLAES